MLRLPKKVDAFFPYPSVRPFQDIFTNTIYEAVRAGNHVLLEGSNGLGKTVAALAACLPIAKDQDLQILYVAKTHRQHDRVIEELNAISRKQLVSGLSIRGRCEMCFHPFIARHAPDARSAMEICELLKAREQCPYHEGLHKKRDRCAELQSHISSRPYTAPEIQEICRVEGICPYELTKLLIGDVDIVALSYIYIFDPVIRGAFLKHLEKPMREIILIVDEAHNLPDTATELASDSLSLFAIRQAGNEAKRLNHKDIAAFSRKFMDVMEKMVSQVEEERYIPPDYLIENIRMKAGIDEPLTFFEHLHTTGNMIRRNLLAHGRPPRSHIHKLGEFLLRWLETSNDASFTHVLCRYMAKSGVASARLEIVALDPAKITAPVFSSVYCSVGISGTLEPLESYMKITGLPQNTVRKAVPSPFPREHILPLACCGITTAMKQRTGGMYKKLVKRIAEAVRYSPDTNVGIFTASYEVSQGLLDAGLERVVDRELFIEHQGMPSKQNDALIRQFKSYAERGGAVLLGVEGGRASEGADYPGKEMETVVIVGVPYAQPSPKVEAQIKYYEKQFPGHGREYGYVWPALRRASQAAGRPIRSLDDRGAIIFMDYRFTTAYCRRYLPTWVRKNLKTLPDEDGRIAQELMLFFGFQES
ncbi:MAG: ATP-dependent DNA helicase [Candidatus Bathyarchaeota archaeon BA1]|nr:MAG: ATP-dependent DNA helicase [Candidatus Bathyarchaeota archaeon BA1]